MKYKNAIASKPSEKSLRIDRHPTSKATDAKPGPCLYISRGQWARAGGGCAV